MTFTDAAKVMKPVTVSTPKTVTARSTVNTTPHLTRSKVKQTAIEFAAKYRAGKFKRVSPSFLERIEYAVRAMIEREVRAHPSKGMTLR